MSYISSSVSMAFPTGLVGPRQQDLDRHRLRGETDRRIKLWQAAGARSVSQMTEPLTTAERHRDVRLRYAPMRNDGKRPPPLDVTCSRQFIPWMAEHRLSFAFTTYQAAMLFLVGLQLNGRLSLHKRSVPRCMGMS